MTGATGQKRVSERSRKNADWFITPDYATRAMLERELFPRVVWDGCCGSGEMAEEIARAGYMVQASDLHDRGYGKGGIDFLMERTAWAPGIIMNPPFNLATQFARHAVEVLRPRKAALLLQLSFLEGMEREAWFQRFPPSRIWVFSDRQMMWPGDLPLSARRADARGQVAFQWMVWEQFHRNQVGWLPPDPSKPRRARK